MITHNEALAYEKGVQIALDLVKTVREVLEESRPHLVDDGSLAVLTRKISCRLLGDGWRK